MLLNAIAKQIEARSRARARRYEAEYLANIFGLDYELPLRAGQQAAQPERRRSEVRLKSTSGAEGAASKRVCDVLLVRWNPLFDDILSAVSEATRVAPAEIHGRSRLQRIAYARQLAMYLMRQITRAPYPRIGDFFGRGHATVIHACASMSARLPFDVEGRRTLDKIVTIFSDRRRELQNRESTH